MFSIGRFDVAQPSATLPHTGLLLRRRVLSPDVEEAPIVDDGKRKAENEAEALLPIAKKARKVKDGSDSKLASKKSKNIKRGKEKKEMSTFVLKVNPTKEAKRKGTESKESSASPEVIADMPTTTTTANADAVAPILQVMDPKKKKRKEIDNVAVDDGDDGDARENDRVIILPPLDAFDVPQPSIHPLLVSALAEHLQISTLFPLQSFLVPRILQCGDMGIDCCITSPTGSGKSLAFAIPMIMKLHDRIVPRLRALVVVPTRDLAIQLHSLFVHLCRPFGLQAALAIGQTNFEFEQSILGQTSLTARPDILIATPGRLSDHIQFTEGFTLEHLEYLVVDEADRLLSQHFHSWQSTIASCRGPSVLPLHTLLFSATMSLSPLSLSSLHLRSPVFFTHSHSNAFSSPASLNETYIVCGEGNGKISALLWALRDAKSRDEGRTVVFMSSIDATHNLKRVLEVDGQFKVEEFHGGMRQGQRQKVLDELRSGTIDVLITSDAIARGIDIEKIDMVINYDCPSFLKTYLHRVGRTARANRAGRAISLLLAAEIRPFQRMLRKATNSSPTRLVIPSGELGAINAQLETTVATCQLLFEAELQGRFHRDKSARCPNLVETLNALLQRDD